MNWALYAKGKTQAGENYGAEYNSGLLRSLGN